MSKSWVVELESSETTAPLELAARLCLGLWLNATLAATSVTHPNLPPNCWWWICIAIWATKKTGGIKKTLSGSIWILTPFSPNIHCETVLSGMQCYLLNPSTKNTFQAKIELLQFVGGC